jgi:hypothetical protein
MADHVPTILVPIDLHGINRTTLETVVRIAQLLDRGLLGLLLEDLRLQRVADLPFTTEITLSGARERSLLRDHLSMRHSQVGSNTRKLLHELTQRVRVPLSFEDASGSRWHTVLERNGHQDIFFPARPRWHTPERERVKATHYIKRLGIVLADPALDSRLLDTAAILLRAGLAGDSYILCQHAPLPEQLQRLYHLGHQVRIQSHVACDALGIIALIQHSPYDLLLLTHDNVRNIPPDLLDAALEKSASQILVVG